MGKITFTAGIVFKIKITNAKFEAIEELPAIGDGVLEDQLIRLYSPMPVQLTATMCIC